MAASIFNLKCFQFATPLALQFHSNNLLPAYSSLRPLLCHAAKKSSSSAPTTANRNNKRSKTADAPSPSPPPSSSPLPKPPAGFVVDQRGNLLSASKHRLATLVDPANNLPLECVVRREFTSSQGHQCMLLCPVDLPIQILRSTGVGWSDVVDDELESIMPAAAYALAKIRMYLVYSGYCYTARGGYCYSEENIFDFHADGKEADDSPTESIEITHFSQEGEHYMIYTPSDPLLFVAVKDQNGMLQIADDELLEDPAVTRAIDEETEFNALVEEEAALRESLLGKS
ncbi:hypothetical protein PIB30_118208 [Stylosanthes scabra]|uniref:Uncharacterized protein n=1 Tax=Stylosanthes scabra TaxID=79078 RepID=A0ABU6X542_9FABA|nr:hypothetical protein [Stylosanthes scabra]